MKRALCFVFALVLLSWCPVGAAPEQEVTSLQPPATVQILHQRFSQVAQRYPVGSYFTKNGQACTHHYACSARCNCVTVTAQQAGTAGNMQCMGFVRMLFWQIFGLPYSHYNSSKPWQIAKDRESQNVTCVLSWAPGSVLSAQELANSFSQAYFADILQLGWPHSAFILGTADQGLRVYDANFDTLTCQIQDHIVSWEELARLVKRYGASVYRSVNYPAPEPASLVCDSLPLAPVSLEAPDYSGLSLTYQERDRVLRIWCEEGAFFVSDLWQTLPVEDISAFGLALSPKVGERLETGVLQIDFKGLSVSVTAEVTELSRSVLEYRAPQKTEYTVGDPLQIDDAYLYVLTPAGRRFYFSDELSFAGFDSSRPGTCVVSMEADGFVKTFEVLVKPLPMSPAPEDTSWPLWARVLVVCVPTLLAFGTFISVHFLTKKRRRSRRENVKIS